VIVSLGIIIPMIVSRVLAPRVTRVAPEAAAAKVTAMAGTAPMEATTAATAPPASVLSLSWVLHLSFSLHIGTTGSHVPHEGLDQVHATFMPDATQAVSRFPLDLSWSQVSLQF